MVVAEDSAHGVDLAEAVESSAVGAEEHALNLKIFKCFLFKII